MVPKSDHRWKKLVSGEIQPELKCLALKILLSRLKLEVARQPANVGSAVDEVFAFFQSKMAIAEGDYQRVFS